METLGVNISS